MIFKQVIALPMVSDSVSVMKNLFCRYYWYKYIRKTKWNNFIQSRKFISVFQLTDDLATTNDGDESEKSIMKFSVQV